MKLFGELIAQPHLAQIETVLGDQLIRADVLRIEIEALRYSADRDRMAADRGDAHDRLAPRRRRWLDIRKAGPMKEIVYARIKSTMLGTEDHGIFTCYLYCEGGGWGCGFGGYALDKWSEVDKRRIGSAYGLEFIKQILDTLEIESWEKLPGTVVRVETEGVGGGIGRIGHFLKEKWFDPHQFSQEFAAKEKKSA
jgi:hypothetical protein